MQDGGAVLRGISAFSRAPVDFDRASELLEGDVPRLLAAELAGDALRMDVVAMRALGADEVALPVRVQVGPARPLAGTLTRDVRWWPVAGEHALSHFDGALKLRPVGRACDVELSGRYLLPASLAEVFGGGLAAHRSARQSLGVLVDRIAERLAAG